MRALWVILGKDLRLRARDGTVLMYGVVAPFVLAAVLGLVFGNLDQAVTLRVVVAGADGSQLRTTLVDQVLPTLAEDGLVESVEELGDRDAAVAAVDADDADVGFVVLPGGQFGPGGIEVLGSVERPSATTVAEAIAGSVVRDARVVAATVAAAVPAGVAPEEAIDAALAVTPVTSLEVEAATSGALDATTGISAGMAVFFLLFAVGLASTGLLEEERNRTLARLRAAPVAPWSILASKAVLGFVIGTVSLGLLALGTSLVLGAEWGPVPRVAPVIVAGAFAAIGVVSAVASVTRTPEGAANAQGVVGTIAGALGGSFFPVATGGLLGVVSALTPHRWFLEGITAAATGAPTDEIVLPVVVLLGMGVVTLVVAAVRFRRRIEVAA